MNTLPHMNTVRGDDPFRDPSSFSPKNQMNASLVILPGGLHAIFIRSALSAMRVYEQTVTGSGLEPNYVHWFSERKRKGAKRTEDQRVRHQSSMRRLQVSGKILLHHTWIIQGSVSLHHLTFSVDQKLGEIPLDAISHEAFPVGLLLQPLPQRMSGGPVHIDLTEHVKLGVVGLCKLLDLRFISGLLVPKLVRREAKDAQTSLSVRDVHCRKLRVVYWGFSSLRGNVGDDDNIPPVFFEGNQVAINIRC